MGRGGRLARVEKQNSNLIREIQQTKLTKKKIKIKKLKKKKTKPMQLNMNILTIRPS